MIIRNMHQNEQLGSRQNQTVRAVEERCEPGFSFDANLDVIFGKSQ